MLAYTQIVGNMELDEIIKDLESKGANVTNVSGQGDGKSITYTLEITWPVNSPLP